MNPISVNSAAIINFGFKTTFDTLAGTLLFDITGLTTFKTGGQSNVLGIAFSVIDPSGLSLATIDFTAPQIIPVNTSIYLLSLVSGFAKFGWYTIVGSIKDADNQIYTITLKKQLCQPNGFASGYVPGTFEVNTDCAIPKLTVSEITSITYQGLKPYSATKTGMISYPPGTLAPLSITTTPIIITGSGNVYTGRYTINNITTAIFDLGDNCYVVVYFKTTAFEKVVNCTTDLVTVFGCLNTLYTAYKNDPYGTTGIAAKQKIDQVNIPVILAIIAEKAGYDSSDYVTEISKILGCPTNVMGSIPVMTI